MHKDYNPAMEHHALTAPIYTTGDAFNAGYCLALYTIVRGERIWRYKEQEFKLREGDVPEYFLKSINVPVARISDIDRFLDAP